MHFYGGNKEVLYGGPMISNTQLEIHAIYCMNASGVCHLPVEMETHGENLTLYGRHILHPV